MSVTGRRTQRSSPLLVTGGVVITLLGAVAIFADWLAPYNPKDPRAGAPLEPPSRSHLLGTTTPARTSSPSSSGVPAPRC